MVSSRGTESRESVSPVLSVTLLLVPRQCAGGHCLIQMQKAWVGLGGRIGNRIDWDKEPAETWIEGERETVTSNWGQSVNGWGDKDWYWLGKGAEGMFSF